MGCQWAATGRCHCLWKERWMAARGSKGEKRQREWARPKQPCPFAALSSFYIPVPLPTWTKVGLCFYLLASGAALAVTGHCGWMCSRNASAWLYTSMERISLFLTVYNRTKGDFSQGFFSLCFWIAGIDLFHLSICVPQITSYFICFSKGLLCFLWYCVTQVCFLPMTLTSCVSFLPFQTSIRVRWSVRRRGWGWAASGACRLLFTPPCLAGPNRARWSAPCTTREPRQ